MTYHPWGNTSSSDFVRDESWLSFNMLQSSHDIGNMKNYALVQKDYALIPVRPVIDGEPRYEDTPINIKPDAEYGFFDGCDARVMAYWAVLSGACGHTYGHHSVWPFYTESFDFFPPGYFLMDWRAALHRPGAKHMRHMKNLFLSRPFLELKPCQELIAENYGGMSCLAAARGRNYAYIYTPSGLRITARMGLLEGASLIAYWYNPREGEYYFAGEVRNEGVVTFAPPSSGRGCDWVLVLDAISLALDAAEQRKCENMGG